MHSQKSKIQDKIGLIRPCSEPLGAKFGGIQKKVVNICNNETFLDVY